MKYASYMEDLKRVLEGIEDFREEVIERECKAFLESRDVGFGQVLLPFRIALAQNKEEGLLCLSLLIFR